VTSHYSLTATTHAHVILEVKCLLYRASAAVLANQSRPGSADRWEAAFASAVANAPPVDGWRGCEGIAWGGRRTRARRQACGAPGRDLSAPVLRTPAR
jgi:hypothetical protein